MISNYSAVSG